MAANKQKPKVKIKYRHSSTLLKCVILTAIILSTVALLVLQNATTQQKMKEENLRHEAAELEHHKRELEARVRSHGTVEDIQQYAELVLGFVDPDTVYFEVETTD